MISFLGFLSIQPCFLEEFRGEISISFQFTQTKERTISEVPFLIERGEMVWDDSRGNTLSVLEWQRKMSESLEWVDMIFMIAFAKMHEGDIVILPTFPRSGWPGDGSLRCIRGGRRVFPVELSRSCREGVDSPAPGVPFLLGVAEGGIFCKEHFQVYKGLQGGL